VHGTGCALSAAIAAQLGRGKPLHAAIEVARGFVRAGIAHAHEIGSGRRVLGFAGAARVEGETS
jgi:hydroxymethylpyrimidine/phosphomethylpyrimidine kinase